MRLATYRFNGGCRYGLVRDEGIIDLSARLGSKFPDLRSLLAAGIHHARKFENEPPDERIECVHWLPVIPEPGQIICVGLNYKAHAAEVGRPVGAYPTIFLRVAQSQIGHRQPIVKPKVSVELDYEAELALVVGKTGRHIAEADALDYVAGYSLYNDASVRDWQRHSGQYSPGKNFPATGAFGPWLVTADEVPDPAALEIAARLNGEVVQYGKLTDLIFSIPFLLSYISTFTELRPGDVIITGTPAGVGSMRKPPLWLRPGDTIEVEVPGIGLLANPVVQES